MPPSTVAIYLYLLDLCVDVTSHRHANLMSPENMAIVFAPNLFDPSSCATPSNPAAMFKANEIVSNFLRVSIDWRAQQRKNDGGPSMDIGGVNAAADNFVGKNGPSMDIGVNAADNFVGKNGQSMNVGVNAAADKLVANKTPFEEIFAVDGEQKLDFGSAARHA